MHSIVSTSSLYLYTVLSRYLLVVLLLYVPYGYLDVTRQRLL